MKINDTVAISNMYNQKDNDSNCTLRKYRYGKYFTSRSDSLGRLIEKTYCFTILAIVNTNEEKSVLFLDKVSYFFNILNKNRSSN